MTGSFGCKQGAGKADIPNTWAISWRKCNSCKGPIPAVNGKPRGRPGGGAKKRKMDPKEQIADTPAAKVWSLLADINDPEVPVLSVIDLGIVREVNMLEEGPEIVITPTYSGCPAMD